MRWMFNMEQRFSVKQKIEHALTLVRLHQSTVKLRADSIFLSLFCAICRISYELLLNKHEKCVSFQRNKQSPIFDIKAAYYSASEEFVNHTRSYGRNGRRLIVRHMVYTPQHIANYFLDRSEDEGRAMTQLKLIKLVYIAYGWYLALKGERLFYEPIQAWKHGPVIRSLYDEFKHFGKQPIEGKSQDLDLDTWDMVEPRVKSSDLDVNIVLNKVWAAYRGFAAWDLRQKTHEKDGPWHRVYKDGMQNIELNDEDIKEHYQHRIAAYLDAIETRT